MATDDWYRNKTWDNEIEVEFDARLKRSRGAFNKAQYLRVQASYLLSSNDKELQQVGIRLMERLVSEYPTENFSTIFGQEQLGDYYFMAGDLERAESYFRIVTDFYIKNDSRNGTSAMADLKLAETILLSNQIDKLQEAYQLCKDHPVDELMMNNDKFYYAELLAILCDKMNKKQEAKNYAKQALSITQITEPQFNRHKTVGLVKATNSQLKSLEEIVNQ